MRVRILDKLWNLRFVPRSELPRDADGVCDPPDKPGKEIRVSDKLKGERELAVTLHEILHAADWHKCEEWIETVAEDAARILHRRGYRRE